MRIGILHAASKCKGGGVYQYSLSIIEALKKCREHEFFIFYTEPSFQKSEYETENCKTIFIRQEENLFFKSVRKLTALFNLKISLDKYKVVKNYNLDLLIDPATTLIGYLLQMPYIVTIHDLMHKYYPNFPEYSFKIKVTRDLLYKKAAKYSLFTIVDSGQGKEDLIRFYKIPKNKIKIIPCLLPPWIYKYKDITQTVTEELLLKYNLPDNFIFYPAQFWYHKNHIRLIQALSLIRQKYKIKVPLVLVGSPKENYQKTINLIKILNMNDQVIHLGYVSDKEIVALYKKATALVFPSLLGPTNIPPIEAMVLGTPVVCSNLFEMPNQIGNAGFLFDPFNIKDMAEKIYKIWIDEKLREELIQKGYDRTKNLTLENYAKKWEKVIDEALKLKEKRYEE